MNQSVLQSFVIESMGDDCIYNRMDISRGILDNLMGRDRNLPKNSVHSRDHYSNSDVCKPFLICFCFNTLFPNTVYDEGPCNKRHDTYLKNMFDNDPTRGEHERQYIRECISWIERRLQEAEQKTKKNQNTIENKTSSTTERPRQILDRILAIDKDIEEMMKKAEIFGENGQIDDSSRCLQEVERLRERRKEIDLMGDNLLAVVKQQKICEICGAIQTINDTEKRIQMHLEGKIHQGFLKLRTEIETLKIRLEILQQRIDKEKGKNEKDEKRQKEKEKEKEKEREKEKEKEKEKQKEREKEKEKEREKEKEKEQERKRLAAVPVALPIEPVPIEAPIESKPRQSDKMVAESREKGERERQKQRSSSHKKKKKEHKHKEQRRRERSGEKDYDRHDRSRSKEHRKEKKDKEKKKRDRSQEKEHKRDRSRERERERRNY